MKSLQFLRITCFVIAIPVFFARADGQIVPGTGIKHAKVGDNFEDENWQWIPNGPKSSREQDEQERRPLGGSNNGRWFESPKRGMPDVVQRVETPAGGIPGSKGSLRLQTLNSGIPGRISGRMEQDDLVMACTSRMGAIDVSRGPNCTCRIWLPPFQNWENRSGTHFGYRMDLKTTVREKKQGFLFSRTVTEQEAYWPGFFFEFHSETDPKYAEDEAILLIRGNNTGHEVKSVKLTPGWWTFGMSVTPDGQVHFYARQGVEDLRASDHLYSSYPYSYTAELFATHFFNNVNTYDGKTWSTPFIVDDPAVYSLR
ncbi:MAG: hypothetical protein KDA81_16575 [Planctomycetaceae bacterium]|nr:hypothetical protein [Planctomycetaceae bacterium]